MSQPTPYTRQYNFTNSFAASPTQVFPGASLDLEFNTAKATLDQLLQNIKLLQNDDGTIKNSSIGAAQLSVALQTGFLPPTVWSIGVAYSASPASTVFTANKFYSCAVSHSSSAVFATDLAAGRWSLIADLSSIPLQTATNISVTPTGGIVTTDAQSALAGLDTRITTNEATLSVPAWSTGDVKLTIKTVADSGWLMMADQTIGSATSGATYANTSAQALFLALWANVSDTYAPVTTGRGASAAIDWAANKKIALTKVLGRALAIGGAGSALTSRSLGQTLGEETHQLLLAELAAHAHATAEVAHAHDFTIAATAPGGAGGDGGTGGGATVTRTTTAVSTGLTVSSAGSNTAHNNMQPTSFWNVMIKL